MDDLAKHRSLSKGKYLDAKTIHIQVYILARIAAAFQYFDRK